MSSITRSSERTCTDVRPAYGVPERELFLEIHYL